MARPERFPRQHLVAVGMLLLYAVGSVWWVRNLGQVYRAGLLARAKSPPSKAPTMAPPVEQVVDAPVRSPDDDPPTLPVAVPPEPAPTRVVLEPARPPVPTPAPVVAPAAAAAPALAPPVLDAFWDRPEQKRAWDLQRMTNEDERQLGATLNMAILKLHEPLIAGPLPGRLVAAAEPFLKARSRQDLRYRFTVLNCDEVNAFSHPGGYIYVCRGIFDLIADDEDQALEFLVGHEIAHVDQSHAIICLRDPKLPTQEVGTSPVFCTTILPLAYPAEQDLEADRWACQVMSRAGRSKHETLKFLRKLEAHAKDRGFGNERMKPFNPPPVDLIDNHLRAHIIPRDRLASLLERFWKPAPQSR